MVAFWKKRQGQQNREAAVWDMAHPHSAFGLRACLCQWGETAIFGSWQARPLLLSPAVRCQKSSLDLMQDQFCSK